jgi:hypothetical protein
VRGPASRVANQNRVTSNGCALRSTSRQHLDETVVVIAGRRFWLWRAVGDEGDVSICCCNAGALSLAPPRWHKDRDVRGTSRRQSQTLTKSFIETSMDGSAPSSEESTT